MNVLSADTLERPRRCRANNAGFQVAPACDESRRESAADCTGWTTSKTPGSVRCNSTNDPDIPCDRVDDSLDGFDDGLKDLLDRFEDLLKQLLEEETARVRERQRIVRDVRIAVKTLRIVRKLNNRIR